MEKILTQDEIDALFRAAQKGQIPGETPRARSESSPNSTPARPALASVSS